MTDGQNQVNVETGAIPEKPRFRIRNLSTIAEINSEIGFLGESFQKRNVCYQLQYLDFQLALWESYKIDKSIAAIFFKDFINRIYHIIEGLMFGAIMDIEGPDYFGDRGDRFGVMREYFRSKSLITVETYHDIGLIADLRHNVHPMRQESLDFQLFTIDNARRAYRAMRDFLEYLRLRYAHKNMTFPDECPYCEYYRHIGDQTECPYCYNNFLIT